MSIVYTRKSFVQKKLRGKGFKVKPEVYEVVDRFLGQALDSLIDAVASDNIKTLGMDDALRLLKIAKPKSPVSVSKVETNSEVDWCDRCIVIEDYMIPLARSIQSNVNMLADREIAKRDSE